MLCICNVHCSAQNAEHCVNISAFKFQSAADHTGYLVLMPKEQLCYSENVFNGFNCVCVFFKRISDFLDELVSKYGSGGPCFVP